MYKTSSGAKELTQIKIHTKLVYRKFTDEVYIICVRIIDLQRSLDLQNLCHLATTKN